MSTHLLRTTPVIIRYPESGDTAGSRPDQLTLWVSNRTDLPLMVCPSRIEARTDSVSTNWLLGHGRQPLRFSEEVGKPAELIGPHQEEEACSFHCPLPQQGHWRLKAIVLARQSCSQKLRSDLVYFLGRLHLIPRRIDTNVMPLITISGGQRSVEWYRPVCEVTSEEVRAVHPAVSRPKTSPVVIKGLSRASPEAISRARLELQAKLKELDETATTPRTGSLK